MSQKIYRCTNTCTFGKPARFYDVGDILLFDGPCPLHFVPGTATAEELEETPTLDNSPVKDAEHQPETLAEVAGDIKTAGQIAENMSADEPCSVQELAEKIGANIQVIKELSGKRAKTDKLTSAEISAVKVALAKAQG